MQVSKAYMTSRVGVEVFPQTSCRLLATLRTSTKSGVHPRSHLASNSKCARHSALVVQALSSQQDREQNQWPVHAVEHIAATFAKFVQDAWLLLQRLVHLLRRVHIAAAIIQASSNSASTSRPANSNVQQPAEPPLSVRFSTATHGAVTHLRHTLTDATGTLEVKWRALESTASERMGTLFSATRESAAALELLEASGSGAAASRMWTLESTAAVVEQEEALRRQVFEQVLAELNSQAGRQENLGYGTA